MTITNDGNLKNRFILTEADMQRIIGFLQHRESVLRESGFLVAADLFWTEIKWLDSIVPDHVEIDPEADLPSEAF